MVLVVDGSGRFTAPAGSGIVFESVQRAAREYVEGIDSPAAVSIILAANLPRIVTVRDSSVGAVRDTLRGLEPGYGPADMEAALEIGQSILRDGPGGSIAIISDGRFRIANTQLLDNAGLVEVAAGTPELRIDRVIARQAPDGGMQVLVGVTSTFADSNAVEVKLAAGGAEIASLSVQVPANSWAGVVFEDVGPASTSNISVSLTGQPASETRAGAPPFSSVWGNGAPGRRGQRRAVVVYPRAGHTPQRDRSGGRSLGVRSRGEFRPLCLRPVRARDASPARA